jgi:RHS repeat-associated protein
MVMPGRKFSAGTQYRYGFNGKEEDDEVKGDGNQQDYGMRIYDTRLGKFLSVDPLAREFPYLSAYQFAANSPIENSDLDGAEPDPSTQKQAGKSAAVLTVVTETTIQKGTELAVDGTGKLIQQKARQSLGSRTLGWLASTGGKALGLTLYFVFSPANGHQSYYQEIKRPGYDWQGRPIPGYVAETIPAPQSNPAPLPDPRKSPSPQDNGEESYYVYKTASTDKIQSGYVDKSAGSLPYYGITKGPVIGGRYAASNERAINLSAWNNGIIAQTNYYTAGGIESALVIYNTYGIGMLNTKSLRTLVRTSPALSTSIDNKTITFTDVARIMSGVIWLNKNIPDWKTKFKEKENKKGPNHPDSANNPQ